MSIGFSLKGKIMGKKKLTNVVSEVKVVKKHSPILPLDTVYFAYKKVRDNGGTITDLAKELNRSLTTTVNRFNKLKVRLLKEHQIELPKLLRRKPDYKAIVAKRQLKKKNELEAVVSSLQSKGV